MILHTSIWRTRINAPAIQYPQHGVPGSDDTGTE
jgi:hypothetical protein